MRPYSPGKPIDEVKRELGLEKVVKLASNENPLGPSPKAVAAARAAAETLHLYPDASGYELRTALAQRAGLDREQVMLGNGSDELIHYLGQVMLQGEGTEMVIGDPTFVRYEAGGQLANSRIIKVPLDKNWTHDVEAMARALTPQTRLVYIANPNNPTGTVVGLDKVAWLVRQLPEGALLVHDEAYFEYASHAEGYGSGIELIKQGLPLAVLRTFSKAYGLAGLRIGAGYASHQLVDLVNRIREPFNVNSLAMAAALGALDDHDYITRSVNLNQEGLARVKALAEGLDMKVVESFANFACIDLGRPAQPVFEALLAQGIITRSGHVLGMPHHLRVSIGTPEEMEAFAQAFHQVVTQPLANLTR
jgi:histidinol-phosphate aminotransferase